MSPATLNVNRDTLAKHWTVVFTETAGLSPGGDRGFVMVDGVDVARGVERNTVVNERTIPVAPITHASGWEFCFSLEVILKATGFIGEVWTIFVQGEALRYLHCVCFASS